MKQEFEKTTFTMPTYLLQWLDHVSVLTGYSKSNLVMQAVADHLHKFEAEGTSEHSLYTVGRLKGCYDEIDHERQVEIEL